MNDHATSNSNASAPSVTQLFKSAAAFIACFLISAVIGCAIIVFVNGIVYGLLAVAGIRLDSTSTTIVTLIEFLMVLGIFAVELVILSLHLRRIPRESIINIRCGFLSGITIVSAMFAILLLFLLCQAVLGPGGVVSQPSLDDAKRARAAVEQNRRGFFFEQIALQLSSSEKRYSEAQVIEHLGPPDLVKVAKQVKRFAYFYDRFSNKDWVVYVDFNLNDPYAQFGFNSASVIDHSDWGKYDAK